MKKIVVLSEALQKWSEGKRVEVSLNIKSLKLEDLQWLDDMGAVFSYEVPAIENDLGIPEPAITIESPWEEDDEPDPTDVPDAPPETDNKLPEKSGKRTVRKKIDTGKVKALRNAGWSLQKIADEMGCCAQTVANILGREELQTPESENKGRYL